MAVVGLEFSAAHNAMYDLIHAAEMLVRMLSRQSCAEAASEELRESGRRAHTADWLLMKVRGVRPEEMARRLRKMLRRNVREAMSAGAVARRPVVAIDKTYLPSYSERGPRKWFVGRFMPGTCKAEAYISAKVVGGPAPLHVACLHVPPGEPLDVSVRRSASEMRHCGMRPGTVPADREFGTAAGMREPGRLGLEYLMPVTRHAGIKAAVREHMAGRRPAVSRYTVRAGQPEEHTYRMVICRIKGRRRKGLDPVYGYAVFATSRRHGAAPGWALDTYSTRWGIETGYKDTKSIRPRTTSNSASVRLFMFLMTILAYNLWVERRAESDAVLWMSAFKRLLMRGARECVMSGARDPGGGAGDPG